MTAKRVKNIVKTAEISNFDPNDAGAIPSVVIPPVPFKNNSLLNPDVVPVVPVVIKVQPVRPVVKAIRDTQRGQIKPQKRQTQEEYEREQFLKQNAEFVKRETSNKLGNLAQEAGKLQSDFFSEELSYGLIKGLSRVTLDNKISLLKAEYMKKITLLKEDGKYAKYYDKFVKSIKKVQKKAYKKAKRKYGKKLAKLLFYEAQGEIKNSWTIQEPKSKEVKLLEEEYENNLAKLEEDHQSVIPPSIDPTDLHLSVNTTVLPSPKKEALPFPKKPTAQIISGNTIEEIDIS